MISCLTDKPEFWCLTICTEVAPFNTIETSHFRQLIRILIMFSFNLGHNFFSRFHTPSCLCLFEDPLGLFPCVFCILGLFSKFCCCICPRFGRPNGGGSLVRHVHRRGWWLGVESILWLELRRRKPRVYRVVRVPPTLFIPKLVSVFASVRYSVVKIKCSCSEVVL
jgi:hypothetical protein